MNRFIESNKLWLSLLGLALAIVLLTFIFRAKSPEYQIGSDLALRLINDQPVHVAVSDIGVQQLIDIRPSEEFAQGHPDRAINVPLHQLLNEKSIVLFDKLLHQKSETIIYGSDELQATAPWMLLQLLGYKNLKILKGGFSSANEFRESALSATETSILDTAFIRKKPEPFAKPEKKNLQTIMPVRKEVSQGGGC